MENKKRQLLYVLQMYDFYLYELQLYLDTHPTCPNGLRAFRKYKELRERTAAAYANLFGPISPLQSDCENIFDWVKGPWPWEKEAN